MKKTSVEIKNGSNISTVGGSLSVYFIFNFPGDQTVRLNNLRHRIHLSLNKYWSFTLHNDTTTVLTLCIFVVEKIGKIAIFTPPTLFIVIVCLGFC